MSSFFRTFLWLFVGLLAPGCGSNPVTTWSAQFQSPDGKWIAVARTYQYSGPGNDYVHTTLSLHQEGKGGEEPILDYLDTGDELTVLWTAPTHLRVTLHKDEQIDLLMVKFSTITITVVTPDVGPGVNHQ
jgi:hypothetical protein